MTALPAQPPGEWRARAAATRRQRTERRVLDAALALLESTDFDQVTIEAIARRAEVGPATIYQRYGTKAALVAVVFAERIGRLIELGEHDARRLPVRDATRRHLHRLARLIHRNRPLARALMLAVGRTDGPPRDPRDPRLLVPLPRPLAAILRAAQERGEIAAHVDPDDTAASITSLLLVRVMARAESARQSADFVCQLVLDGLLAGRHPETGTGDRDRLLKAKREPL